MEWGTRINHSWLNDTDHRKNKCILHNLSLLLTIIFLWSLVNWRHVTRLATIPTFTLNSPYLLFLAIPHIAWLWPIDSCFDSDYPWPGFCPSTQNLELNLNHLNQTLSLTFSVKIKLTISLSLSFSFPTKLITLVTVPSQLSNNWAKINKAWISSSKQYQQIPSTGQLLY